MKEELTTLIATAALMIADMPTDEFLAVICTMIETHYDNYKGINPVDMSRIVPETIKEKLEEK